MAMTYHSFQVESHNIPRLVFYLESNIKDLNRFASDLEKSIDTASDYNAYSLMLDTLQSFHKDILMLQDTVNQLNTTID